ncbi:cobyrinate a,c-diamide synthase [Skermanella rosea]|uniref:cobyrinate a,c-diamide synthase n=1 Tax=Skermanella rosea TaxID=1817965 RepID=UPI001E2826D5|nr:cobyrinate a,c-diamide synthase [Skermanella rosea]UEM01248.1 cobyrinate a,c-diamide synthase [Skermanella rosea]
MAAPGLVLAAPASGSGKTVTVLALLRHFSRSGVAVESRKVGPDYIDPLFHAAASGRPCLNLDPWAMRPGTLARLAEADAELLVVEGVMGLFDGAADGSGSTADLAAQAGWPVVLVVDAKSQAQSIAALVHGFGSFRRDVTVSGVILNRVGSARHEALLRTALEPLGVPVLGALPRLEALELPDRHLGLVPAGEHVGLDAFLDRAADAVARHVDTAALRRLARPAAFPAEAGGAPLAPPGQRIAVARDDAFVFAYPHLLASWTKQGAELVPFSPLADETPDAGADAVFLPGGYPELHAGHLAAAGRFLDGIRAAAERGAVVYGECGGYMVLGRVLEDGDGVRHAMAGLLPLETSFAKRRLHLGYREAVAPLATPFGPAGTVLRGHEFHYASITAEEADPPLFRVRDARGDDLGGMGARRGTVMGSFLHVVDARE